MHHTIPIGESVWAVLVAVFKLPPFFYFRKGDLNKPQGFPHVSDFFCFRVDTFRLLLF